MQKGHVQIWLIVGVMIGICLSVPFGRSTTVTVGINHWSRDKEDGLLYPTNASDNVSLKNNSLLWANMSTAAGTNVTWSDGQFHVSANGTSKWNDNGVDTLFTNIDGRDVQLNGSLTMSGDLEVQGNTSLAGYLNVTDNVNANTSDAYFANISGNGTGLTGIEIDISDDTNLTATSPLVLTDDDLSFDLSVSNIFTARQDITLSEGIGFPSPPGDLLMRLRNDGASGNDAWIQLLCGGTGQVGVGFSGGMSESIYYDRNLGTMNIDLSDTTGIKLTSSTAEIRGATKIVKTGTPVASSYALSVQDDGANTYLEILNDGGTGEGVFFGVEDKGGADGLGDAFAIYNYQGGAIDFYTASTASTSFLRMSIENDGDVGFGRNKYLKWFNTATSIQGKGDGPGDEFLTLRSGGNINIIPNATFLTTVTGNLTVTENITGNIHYAEMWMHNDISPNVTEIPLEDIWYNISAFNQDDNDTSLNGFTYDYNNLTCLVAGKYKATMSATHSGGSANNKYHFAVGINGVPQFNTETHERMGNINDITSCSSSGFLDLSVDDLVTVQVMNEDGANDVTIYSININLIRIGDGS